MTKVVVYPSDIDGCGWYRMIAPARALMLRGYDVELVMPGSERQFEVTIIANREVILNNPPECDVVVIQRPLHWTRTQLIAGLQRRGIRVIVDIDDHFRAIHRAHGAYEHFDPRFSPRHNWVHCAEACALADRVTVATPLLGEVHDTEMVVPNRLPSSFLLPEPRIHDAKDAAEVRVGWPGRIATHPFDLEATRQGVGRAQRRLGFEFVVVGDLGGVRRALSLQRDPTHVRPVTYDQYPEMLSTFDVGIAPLHASDFNEAKSWLKPLELAARGVPFVCSPSGPYSELLKSAGSFGEDAGMLANSRQEWAEAIDWYVTDVDARNVAAVHGWYLSQGHTIEANLEQWVEAWWLNND